MEAINISDIFNIQNQSDFDTAALEVFRFQHQHNLVYQEFCLHLGKTTSNVKEVDQIPFLPIEFFKSKTIVSDKSKAQALFTSSGTTGTSTSAHHVTDLSIYQESYLSCFEQFYGSVSDYCVLALLPSYLERQGSSLIYMVDDLIQRSNHTDSGFYLDEFESLKNKLIKLDAEGNKILLIGVSFALLDFVEKHPLKLKNTIIWKLAG